MLLGGGWDPAQAMLQQTRNRSLWVKLTCRGFSGLCLSPSQIRTKNGRRLIRPVSARFMHAKEIEAYEEESPSSEKR